MRNLVCSFIVSMFATVVHAAVSLLVPIAGAGAGANGTNWRTDLVLVNHRDVWQKVNLDFNDYDEFTYGPNYAASVWLEPNSTTTFVDVVTWPLEARGFGALYINSKAVDQFDPDADLDATYRIWTDQPKSKGTTSQSSSAVDIDTLPVAGETQTIIGIRQGGGFRASVGVTNVSYYNHSFRMTAKSPRGEWTTTMTVPGYSVVQVPLQPETDLGYVTIVVEPVDVDGDPWAAFASSVDNQTGDSWLVNGVVPTRKRPTSLVVPIAGHTEGALGTNWTTDLNIINHRDVPQPLTLSCFDNFGYDEYDVDVVLPPSSTTTYEDVLESLFGISGTSAIYINYPFYSPFEPDADIDATYRITTSAGNGGAGTLSQSSNAVDVMALPDARKPREITGVRIDSDFRCSVGVANFGSIRRDFRATATASPGSVSITFSVAPYSVAQAPLPVRQLGYVTIVVEPLDSTGAQWTAFASSVDNVSSDSWLVNAMPQ